MQAGMIVENEDRNFTREQKVEPAKIRLENIPGNSTVKVRWIVSGRGKYAVTVDSAKGGLVTK